MTSGARSPSPPPLLSPGGAALALAAAVLLLWPMALVTPPLVYFDSFAYEQAGEKALDALAGMLPSSAAAVGGEGAAGGGESGEGGLGTLRSAAWSVGLAVLGGLPWGAVAACALQTAATLFVLGALVPPGAGLGGPAVLGAVGVGLLSGLPWYASYAMPDILGALLLAYYAALAGPLDRAGPVSRIVLGLLACFAVLAHYGHVPLAAALAGLVLLLRARRLSATLVLGALAPLVAAVAINVATGLAVERLSPAAGESDGAPGAEASLAPRRLPVLLARSIEDGVALPHLREACTRNAYRSCAFLGDVPDNVDGFLWGAQGIHRLTAAEMAVLRAEETRIVLGAARADPLRQGTAFLRNAALQFMRVGTDELFPLAPPGPAGERRLPVDADADAYPVLGWADAWVPAFTFAALALLVLRLVTGRLHPALVLPAALVFVGLVLNAAIYGGLSYPVDRYGGRLAWLLPALLAIDLATRDLSLNSGAIRFHGRSGSAKKAARRGDLI